MASSASAVESTCYGTVSKGRIENSVKLPEKGNNFIAYSALGVSLGRTHVHSKVEKIMVAAYKAMEQSAPGKVFIYGETAWPDGGRIRPHKTHKNGLSVDFFVPVTDTHGKSVYLPTGMSNKFGYDIEFDGNGQFGEYSIDFKALGEHLYQLHVAAITMDSGIALVILEPAYLPKLLATPRGKYLKENLKFMQGKAWVRHDEHYHVDFAVVCKPYKG